jgi:hypothetical protein
MKLNPQLLPMAILLALLLLPQRLDARLFTARLIAVDEETSPAVQLGEPQTDFRFEANDASCEATKCGTNNGSVERPAKDDISPQGSSDE